MNQIDCKKLAQEIKNTSVKIAQEAGITPTLAVISVGDDPASKSYVNGKRKDCEECDFNFIHYILPDFTKEDDLLGLINEVNRNDMIHGVIVQLPLPKQIRADVVCSAIDPKKDVDGFGYHSAWGLMRKEYGGFRPCTPSGCVEVIKRAFGSESISGKNAVVIGRSNIVGRPMAEMLVNEDVTVSVCHSKTNAVTMRELCKNADIIVVAVGKRSFLTADMVKPGACVIDVGINRNEEGKLCGDVDYENVKEVAGYVTPVPGGIGLMTRAFLIYNVAVAASNSTERNS